MVGSVITMRRRSAITTEFTLPETATKIPQPECIFTPMAAGFMCPKPQSSADFSDYTDFL
jgi:hypothetical protein